MSRYSSHVNERLANLVINEQLSTWDKNNFFIYKLIYLILKVWIFFELWHSHLPQQFNPSVEVEINFIDDGRQ